MKIITNDFFKGFCDVIKRSLKDPSKYTDCLKGIISASEDDDNHAFVYSDTSHDMAIIKLDEYTKDFEQKRKAEYPMIQDHQPKAVDAVCVNKRNEWFLIEFKNQPLDSVLKSTPQKMLSSIWLIAFLYSNLSEQISAESDILKFAREHITFITVVSSDKNEKYIDAIGTTWEEDGTFYTPRKFLKYKGYYFKDIYVLTESGLRFFIEKFDA